MIAKVCLLLLSSAALLLTGVVSDKPISNCKTWRTCNRRLEPNGCSISYEYTDCDNIRGVRVSELHQRVQLPVRLPV